MTTGEALVVVTATAEGPWGPVRIATGGHGVVAVEMLGTAEEFAAGLERRGFVTARHGDEVDHAVASLAQHALAAIEVMLSGGDVDAAAVPVDLADRPEWDRLVL